MSVYIPPRQTTYVYDFWYRGKRYYGNTYQTDLSRAELVQAKIKLRLREERGGIAVAGTAPTFTDWAEIYYAWCTTRQMRTGRPKRLDRIKELLRVVLRFWGQRPDTADSPMQPAPDEEAPFHALSLQDPLDEPHWIEEFERWMDRRGSAGSTRNHYMTTLSRMYVCAMLPLHRKETGITMNPFSGQPRAPKATKTVALTPAQLQAWVGAMSYHARLAVAIAVLAPKLRLANVLTLDWCQHLDSAITTITIPATEHKSGVVSGQPLVQPVSAQLREILLDARRRTPHLTRVVTYRGQPIASIRDALKGAARAVGIVYGRDVPDGVTFHALRHTASTLFARLGVNPWLHRDAIGHKDLTTTAGYTHLQLEEQRPVFEALSVELPLTRAVTTGPRRAVRTRPGVLGKVTGPHDPATQNIEENRTNSGRTSEAPARSFIRNSQKTEDFAR